MPSDPEEGRSYLPLSLLNDFLFCPRRAALKTLDGCWGENEHTVVGDLAHEHADLPGYETSAGVTVLRALPVFSDRLGLSGRCDIVERLHGGSLRPVEYKKGPRRRFANDDVQLCAQALCLEEMTGFSVPSGAIFHAATRRRREVALTPQLRQATEAALASLRAILAAGQPPFAILKPACSECSLYSLCLPEITSRPSNLFSAASALFQVPPP